MKLRVLLTRFVSSFNLVDGSNGRRHKLAPLRRVVAGLAGPKGALN